MLVTFFTIPRWPRLWQFEIAKLPILLTLFFIETAIRLVKKGMSTEDVSAVTELALEQIEQLTKEIS